MGIGFRNLWAIFSIPFFVQSNQIFAAPAQSHYEVLEEANWHNQEKCRIRVKVIDAIDFAKGKETELPVRVIITASDNSHPDGSGRGTYRDGRFYAYGEFSAEVPPGKTEIFLSSGPNYIPLTASLLAKQGKEIRIVAKLVKWFSPQSFGWFCGDNHVHVRHDPTGEIKVDEEYAALQAMAEGLDYITEADGGRPKEFEEKLSTFCFLYRQAPEIRPGCFVGHVNTPGIIRQISREEMGKISRSPLPIQEICNIASKLGGVVIYTHTLPLPRLHWMGATESLSDALLGKYANAFDISNKAEEVLWFTLLNLGAKIAASGSTDTALIRRNAIPPGLRRIYAHSGKLDYRAIVEAIRAGKTFATNGGPIFPFFTVNGKGVGETIITNPGEKLSANAQIFHLYPLRSAELIRNGKTIHKITNISAKDCQTTFVYDFAEKETAWYVVRAEDERGNWAITSPIYFERQPQENLKRAWVIAIQIGNFARFVELRRDFFAHIIVTTRGMTIDKVLLMRDGNVVREFLENNGNFIPSGKVPVVELGGEYSEGWIWHPDPKHCVHFLADFPVKETGWYSVRLITKDGYVANSEAIYFDSSNPNSQQISALSAESEGVTLRLRGYGEEMPLSEIKIPFEGDHWWYPKNTFWELEAEFYGTKYHYNSGWKSAREKFKP